MKSALDNRIKIEILVGHALIIVMSSSSGSKCPNTNRVGQWVVSVVYMWKRESMMILSANPQLQSPLHVKT